MEIADDPHSDRLHFGEMVPLTKKSENINSNNFRMIFALSANVYM